MCNMFRDNRIGFFFGARDNVDSWKYCMYILYIFVDCCLRIIFVFKNSINKITANHWNLNWNWIYFKNGLHRIFMTNGIVMFPSEMLIMVHRAIMYSWFNGHSLSQKNDAPLEKNGFLHNNIFIALVLVKL